MLKCSKTHHCRVRDLVGSNNRERRGAAETIQITQSLTRGLFYAVHVRRYILLANICNEYARQSSAYLKYDLLLTILRI